MAALRRTMAGAFGLEQAVGLSDLLARKEAGEDVEALLLPVDSMFSEYPALILTPAQEKRCRNGGAFTRVCPEGLLRLYGQNGEFLALGRCEQGRVSTVKSFFEVE